jgi:hypothetical protein
MLNTKLDPSHWIVKTKGWALSHNSSTAKQKMMMGNYYISGISP